MIGSGVFPLPTDYTHIQQYLCEGCGARPMSGPNEQMYYLLRDGSLVEIIDTESGKTLVYDPLNTEESDEVIKGLLEKGLLEKFPEKEEEK